LRIADVSIHRPVFATMLVGSLVVLGAVSYGRLGVDLFPHIEFPYVAVTTTLEGASPETIETEVTDVIEEALNTISGIEELRSVSSEGLSQVFLQFELDEDPDVKAQDVRDKVARARGKLPVDAESPIVEKIDPDAAPILSVMVAGQLPVRELTDFAKRVVKERLQRVPGVGSITIVGGREREIRVWADGPRMRSHGLAVDEVIAALRAEHAEVPGGSLETGGGLSEFAVKTKGEVESVRGFEGITVAFREGQATRLRDVARVEDGMEDERSYAELDGTPGVALEVRRQSGRNTVEVARQVKAVVAELQGAAPAGVGITVARDISRFIEASAHDVAVDVFLGGLLAVLVTLVFLRSTRATLIVSVAIPASIVATFFLFYLMGFTINILTLLALSLSTGLLVDDAIVVLENIHRHIDAGMSPLEAASAGTAEVAGAVIAATAAVLAVFVPIAFMEGVIGRFFFEYGLAISFAVAVSLLVAVTLTPTLCARVLRREEHHGRVFQWFEDTYRGWDVGYGKVLERALQHRPLALLVALLSIPVGVLFATGVPLEFSGRVDRSEFEGIVELPQGAGVGEAKQVAARIGLALREVPGVSTTFVSVGGGSRGAVNEISLYAGLTPKNARDESQLAIMGLARESVRRAVPNAKSVNVNEVSWISGGGFTSYNMEYGVQGADLATLQKLTDAIVTRMRADPSFIDTKSSFDLGKPEVQLHIDRARAADLGVSTRTLANTVRAVVGGMDVATYEEGGTRYDVRLRGEESQRDNLAALSQIQVRSASGGLVELANVATLHIASGPARIDRLNRSRKISIVANNPEHVALGIAVNRLDEIAAEVGLPPGYTGAHEGTAKRMKDSARAVLFAFAMALVALYMILASQFNSFLQPAVIMLTAPLSFSGAFAALWVTGTQMSIFAQIGLVALMGLVMKNGILLVDYANQLQKQGASTRDAIRNAGPVRLRPVLMTTVATIAGMFPVALATSDGSEWRNPMGILVIGGLTSSTVLTLVVVPVAYTYVDDIRNALARAKTLGGRLAPAAQRLLGEIRSRRKA
jgi:HAE1 family hydrophobic/amphiphilic exporter-1